VRLIRKPVLCNYYLTYRCNASCNFCDIWEKPSPYTGMDDLRQNLQDLRKLGVKVVDFTGGEPLLHRQLPQALELAKALGFITTVTTNCLLYPKKAESLKGLIDMLHFSLDAADAEQHNKLRRAPCFDFVLQSIEKALALGERPDILFTVTQQNFDELEKVYHNISLPNKLVLIINPIFTYADGVGEGEQLHPKQIEELYRWGQQKLVYLNRAFLGLRKAGGNQISDPVCKAGSSTLVISPFNELVLPCYHLGQQKLPIERNLYQLWNSPEAQAVIAQEGRLPACQGCTINCYMQPSFSVNFNRYWLMALPSTLKYNLMKGTWRQLL